MVRSRAQWGSGNALGGGREAPLKHVDCLLVPARRDLERFFDSASPGARKTAATSRATRLRRRCGTLASTLRCRWTVQRRAHRGCQARVTSWMPLRPRSCCSELRPAVLRFLRAQRDAQEPAVAVRAHGVGHEQRSRSRPFGPSVEERRVQVQVGVGLDGCTRSVCTPSSSRFATRLTRASHALTPVALRHAAHVGLHHHRIEATHPRRASRLPGCAGPSITRLAGASDTPVPVALPARSNRRAPTIAFNSFQHASVSRIAP